MASRLHSRNSAHAAEVGMSGGEIIVKWRPVRIALFLVAAWFFGSIAMTAIVFNALGRLHYGAVAMGVWALILAPFSYLVFCLALNSTSIRVIGPKLKVRSGPLPGGNHSETDVNDVDAFFTQSVMTTGARGAGGRIYTVMMRTRSGKTVPMVNLAMIVEPDEADRLAQEIQTLMRAAQV